MALPKLLLHPTDFSPTADRALAVAARLAGGLGCPLRLLHVIERRGAVAEPGPTVDQLLAERRVALGAALAERSRRLGAELELVEAVLAGPVIRDRAGDGDGTWVVLGRDGAVAGGRAMGSVADEVVRFAAGPVLVVPGGPEAPAWPWQRILVPVDFSPGARQAVTAAADLARTLGAGLELLHVVDLPPLPEIYAPVAGLLGQDLAAVEARAEAELAAWAAELAPGLAVERSVAFGRAAGQIVAFAAERRGDLVVMANRGLSPLARLLLGTTAEAVVREASVPVLVVRAPAD